MGVWDSRSPHTLEGTLGPDIPRGPSHKALGSSLTIVCQLSVYECRPRVISPGLSVGLTSSDGSPHSDLMHRKGEALGFIMNRPSPTPEPREQQGLC